MRTILALAAFTILFVATYCQTEDLAPPAESVHGRKAPMRNCDNLEKGYSTVPGNFMVYLFPGHSFEDHSRAVGKDMAIYKEHWLESLFPDRVVYACDDVGDDLLDAIRNDPGVDGVECNITPGAMIPEMYFNEADGKWHDMFTEEVWEI